MTGIDATAEEKPNLDQPARITHLNQAIDIVEKKADQEYAASREWKFHAGVSSVLGAAGIGVGIAVGTVAAPLMVAPLTAVGISVFAAKKIKEGALREVAQEFRNGQSVTALSATPDGKPNLNGPVQVTGMNQAMDLLDKKEQKAMSAAKGWGKTALAGGVLAVGLAAVGVAPAAVLGYTAVVGAMAGYNYLRAKVFKGLKDEFNGNAAKQTGKMAPAVEAQAVAPAKPSSPGMKI